MVLSPCDLAFEYVACHHWQHLHRLLLHLLLPVLVEGAGVVRAERTRRSLRFFGGLYVTKGGLGMACFSFLEACGMGRCFLMTFIKLISEHMSDLLYIYLTRKLHVENNVIV